MRCAADPGPEGSRRYGHGAAFARRAANPGPRRPGGGGPGTAFIHGAAALAAALTAGCLLAACTASPANHGASPGHSRPAFRRFGPPVLLPGSVAVGSGGTSFVASGPIAFIGGPGRGGSRPAITLPTIPPANSSLTVQMPLEAYQAISTQQQEALADASNLLIQRCMAAKGFQDSSSASPPFSSVTSLEAIEIGGAGLTSITQARTFGFVKPKGSGSSSGGPAIIGAIGAGGFGQSLKAGQAYAEALFGFGPGSGTGPGGHVSCLQQASKQVYGPIVGEPAPDPVPQIAQQAVSFTTSDPRIHAVEHAWSRCMARHFYHYSTPQQLEGRHWRSPPGKAEINTAVADVACKLQTNLLNTWLAVEAAYQQALIGRNLATLAQLQANFAPMLRRANAALAASAQPAS
jgi:hypothetical protein